MRDCVVGEPLDAAMDNVDAWRLGEAARETMKNPGGDLIDTGLILCRLLREKGYRVVKDSPDQEEGER